MAEAFFPLGFKQSQRKITRAFPDSCFSWKNPQDKVPNRKRSCAGLSWTEKLLRTANEKRGLFDCGIHQKTIRNSVPLLLRSSIDPSSWLTRSVTSCIPRVFVL